MSNRIFGSVCSGIEAASVAWNPLGWEAEFFAEIDPFPSAVLAHHYPETPNLGDFTTIQRSARPISLLVGGTPCQSFSVAGLRGGMADDRGVLALEFLRLADRLGPAWVAWENVPGVLSSNGGRDFGAFLGGLAELGYGWAYRVLDAQYFGVPQRRRRVFVVGRLGDWRGPAAVLFEQHSLSGDSPPRREEGASVAFGLTSSVGRNENGGRIGNAWNTTYVPEVIPIHNFHYTDRGTTRDGAGIGKPGDPAFTIETRNRNAVAAFDPRIVTSNVNRTRVEPGLPCPTLHEQPMSIIGVGVRRLTPLEYERLQGFPDQYTAVPYRGKLAADGPRYKALGNSMAVPVMRWIGQRIDLVSDLMGRAVT